MPNQVTSNETQINTYETGGQHSGQVATLSGGGFAVLWTSDGQDGDGKGAYLQVYGSDGQPVGTELRVDAGTAGNQTALDIAAGPNGGFSVIWHSDVAGDDYYLKHYDALGNEVGAKVLLPVEDVPNLSPAGVDMIYLSNGSYMVSWGGGNDGDGYGIYAQHYGADGSVLDSTFRVNDVTSGDQRYPGLAELSDGTVVITYSASGWDGSSWGVVARHYNPATDTLGIEFGVNTTTSSDQGLPSIAALPDGGYVMTWQSRYQDGDAYGIYGQRLDAAGNKVGGEFQVNTETTGDQRAPDIVTLSDGGWLVTWNSISGQDGDASGIYGQRFDASGSRVGDEFRLNDTTEGTQVAWSLDSTALRSDGSVVATWYSYGQDGDAATIIAKVLSTNIDGTDTGILTEDDDPDLDGLLEVGGVLTATEIGQVEASFTAGTVSGSYGDLTIDASGTWSYAADNAQAAVQSLADGESLTDTVSINTTDGTSHDIVITIVGVNEFLDGSNGDDSLTGGNGNDTIYCNEGHDTAYGGSGDDYISGGDGNDSLYGGGGSDTLGGGAGDDLISGGQGNDDLEGGDGNDTLYGGAGSDTITGGLGDDDISISGSTRTPAQQAAQPWLMAGRGSTRSISPAIWMTMRLSITGTALIQSLTPQETTVVAAARSLMLSAFILTTRLSCCRIPA